jgi:hypothetical protein
MSNVITEFWISRGILQQLQAKNNNPPFKIIEPVYRPSHIKADTMPQLMKTQYFLAVFPPVAFMQMPGMKLYFIIYLK